MYNNLQTEVKSAQNVSILKNQFKKLLLKNIKKQKEKRVGLDRVWWEGSSYIALSALCQYKMY